MKSNAFWRTVQIVAISVLAASSAALAQTPQPARFSGVINDYGPQTVKPLGPWEMRGPWSLRIRQSGAADFSAALTMEMSDYSQSPSTINVAGARGQHTHHIVLRGATVAPLSTGGFEVTGVVANTLITKDGSQVFPDSTVVIDVTGGANVAYSNITLTFQGSATGHFGGQAIHGVVRKVKAEDDDR